MSAWWGFEGWMTCGVAGGVHAAASVKQQRAKRAFLCGVSTFNRLFHNLSFFRGAQLDARPCAYSAQTHTDRTHMCRHMCLPMPTYANELARVNT